MSTQGFGFGHGGLIDVNDDKADGTAKMTLVEGAIEGAARVREGTILEIGVELRRLADYAVEQEWLPRTKASHRKSKVTSWEKRAIDRQSARRAAG